MQPTIACGIDLRAIMYEVLVATLELLKFPISSVHWTVMPLPERIASSYTALCLFITTVFRLLSYRLQSRLMAL